MESNQVEKIISIVSELRSFKNELSVSPGSFIDISIETVSKKEQSFFTENEIILKKLGRINNLYNKDLEKPAATLMVSGDLFKVYFDEDVDLELIKKNLTTRQNKYQEEMNKISQRLANKGFVDRAPKDIVDQEKTNYNNLKKDIDKILVTIKPWLIRILLAANVFKLNNPASLCRFCSTMSPKVSIPLSWPEYQVASL